MDEYIGKDNIRRIYSKNKTIKLCIGKDNTCTKQAKKNNLCLGCKNNRDKTLFANKIEGEIFVANQREYVVVINNLPDKNESLSRYLFLALSRPLLTESAITQLN